MIIKINNPNEWYKVDASCVVRADDWEKLRLYIIQRDRFTCQYCGDEDGPFEADHIMPKARGGTDEEKNLVCACRTCNRSKKDKTPEEWKAIKYGDV